MANILRKIIIKKVVDMFMKKMNMKTKLGVNWVKEVKKIEGVDSIVKMIIKKTKKKVQMITRILLLMKKVVKNNNKKKIKTKKKK